MVCVHWPAVVNPCAARRKAVSNFCFSSLDEEGGGLSRTRISTSVDGRSTTHSGRSVYVVSGYLWGAGTIQGVVTAARPIYRTNWTRKLVKMRANGMIEFPLFVTRARSIELSKPSDLTFSEMDHCLFFMGRGSRSVCIHLRFLVNLSSIV